MTIATQDLTRMAKGPSSFPAWTIREALGELLSHRLITQGNHLRFEPRTEPSDPEHRWYVYDRRNDEDVAGPYATEIQATYVAYHLTRDPRSCPFAPDDALTKVRP